MGSMTRWLDVEVGTGDIDLNTLPSNVALVDLQNDNEVKLIVGDLGRGSEPPKLKIFKGAMQISDMVLPDLPLGVLGFYSSEAVPRPAPLVALAFSSCVYLYRNMKLFYKYYLPSIDLSTCEMNAWKRLKDPANHSLDSISAIAENLKAIPPHILSLQSKNFLTLTPEQQLEFLEQSIELPVRKTPEICCIATLRMNSVDKYSVSCLVVGSEEGDVIVLDPQTFAPMAHATLCPVKKIPYQMATSGLYTVDYRIIVATRDKSVCVVKRQCEQGRVLFTTDEHIVAMEVTADGSIMVICADNTLATYSRKGKKQWSMQLEHRPVAMGAVAVGHLGLALAAVALAAGHLLLYHGNVLKDTLFITDVVSVMKFGQLGQEEHVLVIITQSGNLLLKILKRTADFNDHAAGVDLSPHVSSQSPWLIPKKSKLFLEQSIRERENAIPMHETFQHELNRLRLLAAKTLVEAHVRCDNSVGAGAMEPIRLAAEVEGLGPVFRVTLVIENTSSEKAVLGLAILFHVHTNNYKVSNPYIKVPLLSPGNQLKFPTKLEEVFEDDINPDIFFRPVTGQGGERALVKVLVVRDGSRQPVLAATVVMPHTDPMMLPMDKIQGMDWPESTRA